MARVNLSLSKKFTAALDERMRTQLADFASHSACAGIRNDYDSASKARENHHGSFSKNVPARRFITTSTSNVKGLDLGGELKSAIKEALGTAKEAGTETKNVVWKGEGLRGTDLIAPEKVYSRGALFGQSSTGEQRGPIRVLRKIAQQIAENQKMIITERAYESTVAGGEDPVHNAPRVAKAKGFDWPLVDSGKMFKAIKGWVE